MTCIFKHFISDIINGFRRIISDFIWNFITQPKFLVFNNMTLDQLQSLQSLAEKARQDFLKELESMTYQKAEKRSGLSTQQIFRLVNNQKGQPKLDTIISAYIQLLSYGGDYS